MAVTDAGDASEIVRQFLTKMGWATLVTPIKAERDNGTWLVEFAVAFSVMRFEVDAQSGQIKRYETVK